MVCITPKVCYLSDRSHHRRAIMNEHAKSSHPLPIDETVRTRDELAEILTLVQIGKTRRIPILPVHALPGRYHPLVPGHPGARGCHRRVRWSSSRWWTIPGK